MAIDQPGRAFVWLGVELDNRRVTIPKECIGVHRHASYREFAERVKQATINGDRAMRPVAEDLADQAREHLSWTALDEDSRTGGVHRLDLLRELNRASNLRS